MLDIKGAGEGKDETSARIMRTYAGWPRGGGEGGRGRGGDLGPP